MTSFFNWEGVTKFSGCWKGPLWETCPPPEFRPEGPHTHHAGSVIFQISLWAGTEVGGPSGRGSPWIGPWLASRSEALGQQRWLEEALVPHAWHPSPLSTLAASAAVFQE